MRRDLHAEVTRRLLETLEGADGREWRPPWVSMAARGLPENAATGAHYRGVNVVSLWAEAQLRGFGASKWATYRQWRTLGAQVRRGERGARVVFYKALRTRDEADGDGAGGNDAGERTIPILRSSAVFNACQVEGYADPGRTAMPRRQGMEAIAACEELLAATGAEIRRNAGVAFYDPAADYIGLPADALFTTVEGRYSTAFHELTHWTGHRSRLDRREAMAARFGSEAYAAEELVAELGAAFLCAGFGLEPEPRADHAHYIKHWIALLADDERAIFTAASRASDAVELIERSAGGGSVSTRQRAA